MNIRLNIAIVDLGWIGGIICQLRSDKEIVLLPDFLLNDFEAILKKAGVNKVNDLLHNCAYF